MGRTHEVSGIEGLPTYLISAEQPWIVSEDDFIDGVPLGDLIKRLTPGEHLYLVDYASDPGRTKLTCLVWSADNSRPTNPPKTAARVRVRAPRP